MSEAGFTLSVSLDNKFLFLYLIFFKVNQQIFKVYNYKHAKKLNLELDTGNRM